MPSFSTLNHALQFGTSNPTVSIYGTDVAGYIVYHMPGTSTFYQFEPNTKYFALKVIFDVSYASTPKSIVLRPGNSATEQLMTAQSLIGFYVDGGDFPGAVNSDITSAYFNISGISGTSAILGPITLAWYYEASTGLNAGAGGGTITSIATSSPITGGTITTSGTIAIPKADATHDGYLSQTDWTTFNNKGSVVSVDTNSTLTGGPITTTGTLSINLGHANSWTAEQTFTSHIVVDGYTVDLSAGALTDQILKYDGNNFIAATGDTFNSIYDNIPADNNIPVNSTGGPVTFTRAAVAISQSPAVSLVNTTAAASGLQQYSPTIEQAAQGFETTGNTSKYASWFTQVRPIQGTDVTSELVWWETRDVTQTERIRISGGSSSQVSDHVIIGGPGNRGAISFGFSAIPNEGANPGCISFWHAADNIRDDAYPIASLDEDSFRPPYNLAPISLGGASRVWSAIWAQAHIGVHQNISTSGAVSINTQSGEMCVLTSSASISSITLAAGNPAQFFTLEMVQGNAAYTWPSTIVNARLAAGSFAKTSTSDAVDTITFRYNVTNSTWDEISRTIAIS